MNDAKSTATGRVPPLTREEHIQRSLALGMAIAFTANEAKEVPRVVLDALLNVYLNAAETFGLRMEAGECLAQAGGRILLASALESQAAGLDPFAPPTRH